MRGVGQEKFFFLLTYVISNLVAIFLDENKNINFIGLLFMKCLIFYLRYIKGSYSWQIYLFKYIIPNESWKLS